MIMGTAFDYLLRFAIEHKYSHHTSREWVAENSLQLLQHVEARGIVTIGGVNIPKLARTIKMEVQTAKRIHTRYMSGEELNDELFRVAIVLARIDAIYRAGLFSLKEFDPTIDDGDIKDLRNLMRIADLSQFRPEHTCLLNPHFGDASKMVHGADADIIVDDTLIDIKTTKILSFTSVYYHQLIGYYVLSRIGQVNGERKIDIKNLGIYYSRYGLLYKFPIKPIIDGVDLDGFVKKFVGYAREQFPPK